MADESKWRFRDALHEDNASDLFWSSIKSYVEGDEASALEKIKRNPSIIQSVAVKHFLDTKSMMFVQVTRGTLAYIVIKLFFKIEAFECIKGLIRETVGSTYLTIGLSKFLEETDEIENLVNEMIMEDSVGLEILKALKKSSSETIKKFLEKIKESAKNDIGEKQHIALQLLADHIDDSSISEIFIGFLDDWDSEVRRIVALALAPLKNKKEVQEAATNAFELESEEDIKLLLMKLIGG